MEDFQSAKRARLDLDSPSEQEILRLVAQRESLRQARRFAESDAIREELRSVGVEVYDKEKEWRCRDGRRGLLFTAGPAECPFTDQEIHEMVQEREEARKSKDWDRADAIRDDLRSKGVEIDDKDSRWRTATGRSGGFSGQGGGGPPSMAGSAIRKLVAERERLRASQDFDAADELRRQLQALGVELFDTERVWRSSDGQQGVIITGGHEVDCRLTESDIAARVSQREDARSQKDWGRADTIRDDLRAHGVELLDNQRVWCTTDGRNGSFGGNSHSNAPLMGRGGHAQTQQHAGNSVTQMAAGLAALLAPPVQPRAAIGAPSFQAPRVQPMAAVPTQASHRMPSSAVVSAPSVQSLSTASIIALVIGREKARERHDWEAADGIRSDLRSHGVDVWDKEKVWRANDGRSGAMSKDY